MSVKEISVFILGIVLVGFLYLMKHPQSNDSGTILVKNDTIQQTHLTQAQQPDFNPTSEKPILERILDIPAWSFDLNNLETLTTDELIKAIELAIEQQRFFQPENNNALFYFINLKNLDEEHEKVPEFEHILQNNLQQQTKLAINNHDEAQLKLIISLNKTLQPNSDDIATLENTLSSISTINKFYNEGLEHILNQRIIATDANDAWHAAKACLAIDANNANTQSLVSKVLNILLNDALKAAEEIDFQLAYTHLKQAELLSPDELTLEFTRNQINELKQQRYVWLESQLSIAINQVNVERANRVLKQLQDLGVEPSAWQSYQDEIARMTVFGQYTEFDIFSDSTQNQDKLPSMVVMSLGQYLMGDNNGPKHQQPEHLVHIDYGFAVSQNEISVADFELFIQHSAYQTDAEISQSSRVYDLNTGRIKNQNRVTWKHDYLGDKADKDLPVIHVSWNDAFAYTQWLSQQTGKNYRLLSEAEFEYILRAGSRTLYPWGDNHPTQVIENLTGKLDRVARNTRIRWKKGFEKYNDQFWGPAAVGSFINNPFRLNDTAGNVMEWVMDCWHDSYMRAPIDGSPWINLGCENHVIRGGSWSSALDEFTSSHRFIAKSNYTDARLGFRIAVDL